MNDIRFRKVALEDPEWKILEPKVIWYNPFATEINLRCKRRPSYYVQNVVVIMFVLTTLGLIAYALPPDSLGDRVNIQITLILTVVAFKFVLATQIPRTSYNTLLDYYIFLCTITLAANVVMVCVGDMMAEHVNDTGKGHSIDLLCFYIMASWIAFYTVAWFALAIYKTIINGRGDKEIIFSKKEDSDEMHDFTVTYTDHYDEDGTYHQFGKATPKTMSSLQIADPKKSGKTNDSKSAKTVVNDSKMSSPLRGVGPNAPYTDNPLTLTGGTQQQPI